MFGSMINRDPKNHISLQDWATPEMLVPMLEEEREREREKCRLLYSLSISLHGLNHPSLLICVIPQLVEELNSHKLALRFGKKLFMRNQFKESKINIFLLQVYDEGDMLKARIELLSKTNMVGSK